MTFPCLPAVRILIAAFLAAPFAMIRAAPSDWTDVTGKKIRGEPADVFGGVAVFSTGADSSRSLPLVALSPADCLRFDRELAGEVRGAADWSAATGKLSRELPGRVFRIEHGQLKAAVLAGQPEPKLFVLICGTQNDGVTRDLVRHFGPTYRRIQQVYPGELAAVFCGLRSPVEKVRSLAVANRMPWLVADPAALKQLPILGQITRFEGSALLVVTRNGTPLLSVTKTDAASFDAFNAELVRLLLGAQADNPAVWEGQAHYARAVRPVAHPVGAFAPELLGHPFRADALRVLGLTRVVAKVKVSAEGRVAYAKLEPAGGLTAALAPLIGQAFQRHARFIPALADGRWVEGVYDYVYHVPPADAARSASAAWLGQEPTVEYPIKEWLVLKTIKVDSSAFLAVDRVENGVTILKAITASKEKPGAVDLRSQKSAFAHDWFAPQEAAAIRPAPKLKQRIDDKDYTWRVIKPDGPSVDLQEGSGHDEFCYAYAWTEIEVPEDRTAWLGFGSDDGVKIWLNGEVLLETWTQRPLLIEEDLLTLKLKKGKNQLMLKVQNMEILWGFSCRLRIRDRL